MDYIIPFLSSLIGGLFGFGIASYTLKIQIQRDIEKEIITLMSIMRSEIYQIRSYYSSLIISHLQYRFTFFQLDYFIRKYGENATSNINYLHLSTEIQIYRDSLYKTRENNILTCKQFIEHHELLKKNLLLINNIVDFSISPLINFNEESCIIFSNNELNNIMDMESRNSYLNNKKKESLRLYLDKISPITQAIINELNKIKIN